MIQNILGGLFKRKYTCLVNEAGKWYKISANLTYDKNQKKWFLNLSGMFKGESLPLPENFFDYVLNDTIILKRIGLNRYELIKIETEGKSKIEEYPIEPEEISLAILSKERIIKSRLSFFEKLMPILLFVISIIGVGIFFAIILGAYGDFMKKTTEEFRLAMEIYRNATLELANTIKQQIPLR